MIIGFRFQGLMGSCKGVLNRTDDLVTGGRSAGMQAGKDHLLLESLSNSPGDKPRSVW
ncbi:hypothetical protein H2C83_13075 [Thermoactinomyces sp. AMNI-1]|uniref:Uncharacterized protein n=2 Tax=Thermoactinomyces mirandus TaxID=2756294 RepID=A0A7W1XU02_9BACL|nr:hypothetical protein [Thermoactinomyces mirandus]